jgi:secreted Zn-dependent insulinase-like peptidase
VHNTLASVAYLSLNFRLHLPEPNPFIPTDLSLKAKEAEAFVAGGVVGPKLIEELPGTIKLWHRCV